jgi:MerR family transcriptional regulator, thiopeptide resistance regulator
VDAKRWKIGELASATGLTVRTLHHYDEIGLLKPSERTESGHRQYHASDVRRLYVIKVLRNLGLPLQEIADALESNGTDPRETVRRHLARVDEQLRLQSQLREQLTQLLDALDTDHEPSTNSFIQVMEVMSMVEQYYTPEQLAQLEERRRQLGDEAIERSQQEWADLIAAVETEYKRGTDPSDPRVQALAAKWESLIEQFTGGDPGIRQSLQRMYETEGAPKASRGMVNQEVMEYAHRIIEARNSAN